MPALAGWFIAQAIFIVTCQRDKALDVRRANVGIDRRGSRWVAQAGDVAEVFERVKGLGVFRWRNHVRAKTGDDSAIAVMRGFSHLLRADDAAYAAFVFNHEGFLETIREAQVHHATQCVGAATCGIGHHDFDGALWLGRLLCPNGVWRGGCRCAGGA